MSQLSHECFITNSIEFVKIHQVLHNQEFLKNDGFLANLANPPGDACIEAYTKFCNFTPSI